ncbi:MAG: arginase family protein [Acidobacteriota bacterium]
MREIPAWFGLSAADAADARAVVLGCPLEGQDAYRGGSSQGPAAIREWARTAQAVREDGSPIEGLRVVDFGDVEVVAGQGDATSAAASGEARWRAIEGPASRAWQSHPGAFLLGLGGDHGVTPPLAAAARAARGELAFLLLDAHPDAFDAYDGDRLSHACVLSRLSDRCGYAPEATCLVGVRSYALDELDPMRSLGLVVPAYRWAEWGSTKVADKILQATGGKALYLSLDIDVLDPAYAPGTGYPVAGGPSSRQLLDLLAAVWQRQPVVAMDLVEVAPAIDPSGATASTAAHLCLQVLGHVARRLPEHGAAI